MGARKAGDATLEFLRFRAEETVINTFTQSSIVTPAVPEQRLAMLVHAIGGELSNPPFQAGANNGCVGHVYLNDRTTGPRWDTEGVLWRAQWYTSDITGTNEVTRTQYGTSGGDGLYHVERFDPPVLVAKSTIYCGVEGDNMAAGVFNSLTGWIGYTLEKVSQEVFIAALTSSL